MTAPVLQAARVIKPVYLVDSQGEYALLPDQAIINAGGVSGPSFTVGGKPVLFAGDVSTSGGQTLQGVYDLGSAAVNFTAGKDLVLTALNGKQFVFSAATGNVTVTGDLVVQGSTTTITNTALSTDRVTIHQSAGTYVPLVLEPAVGVVPAVNVVDVKVSAGGASVFSISPTGTTTIQALSVGPINGIDLTALQAQVSAHQDLASIGIKHTAAQVSADTSGLTAVSGGTVQQVIASIDAALTAASARLVRAVEYIQAQAADPWTIAHGQDTKRVQVTVWNDVDEMVIPARVALTNSNTATISFGVPVTGRAVLMLF